MSDDTRDELDAPDRDDDASADEVKTGSPADTGTGRSPSPGALAASRARRIGGRPVAAPPATDGEAGSARTSTEAPSRRRPSPFPRARAATDEKEAPPAKTAATTSSARAARPARPPADLAALARRMERLRWVPALVAAVAVVALLVVGGWQSHGVWWGSKLRDSRNEQQQRVLAAAKTCAVSIFSYDYKNLDAAQKAASACITPAFKSRDYDKTFAVVQQQAPQQKATQTYRIAKGGVQSAAKDGKQWVVLLYGQLEFADSTTTKGSPRLDISSVTVTVTQSGGKYLVSDLNPAG